MHLRLALLLVVGVLGFSTLAIAAPTSPTVRLDATRRRGKAKVTPSDLARVFTSRGNAPVLRLGGTESIVLDPQSTVTLARRVDRARAQQWPALLRRFRAYIQGKATGATPPDQVDHRPAQTPIKYQGRYRAVSAAFGVVAALEWAYGDTRLDLSEEQAWQVNNRTRRHAACPKERSLAALAAELNQYGTGTEAQGPYATRTPKAPCKKAKARSKKQRRHAHRIARYHLLGRGKPGRPHPAVNQPRVLEASLATGRAFALGLGIAGTTWRGGGKRTIEVELDAEGNTLAPAGYQTFVLVAYDRSKKVFVAKTAWGAHKGDRGYVTLSYDYIRAYAEVGLLIDAVSKRPRK